MHIGAHISIAGGVQNAPQRAHNLGCEIMQIFTRSPQGGKAPELTPELIESFKIQTSKFKIQTTYIHTPYYINFASANNRIRYGSAKTVRDELERGSMLGAKYVMTHLGSAKDLGQKEAIKKTVEMLREALDGYAGKTKLLLENSAGTGMIIGDDLGELGKIITSVGNHAISGICLDTQHSFASGYDWRDFEKTIFKIDKEIGIDKIRLIHANDSLTEFASKKDRHAHIGKGQIGLEAFQNFVTFAQKHNIDMILETEHDEVKEDIKTLKEFRT
ncbi:MAG TPA: deoxyribonuclease IV [Candidatus Moranbacteria bacterium]|nr:deoxyribonuclease IV [Candidatus Moranbacteria bacterium]